MSPLAAALVYWNALGGGFVWDDRFLIVDNPRVQSFARLEELLTTDYVFVPESDLAYGYYRPVSGLSLAVDYRIWGANPFGFHLTNLLLHAAAALLAVALALRLGARLPVAAATGLLFAVHPIHTESVAWIAGRTDVLAFVLAAASFLLFLRAEERGPRSAAARAASLAVFALALLAKEMAAVVPLWIGCLLFFRSNAATFARRLGEAAKGALPWLAVLVFYAIARFVLLDIAPPLTPPEHGLGPAVLSAAPTVVRYLGWMAVPRELSAYVQNPYVTRLADPRLLGAILALGALALAVRRLAKERPEVGLHATLLALSFAPILNLVRAAGPADMGAMMAERFAYLPSFPFLLLAVGGADALLGRGLRPPARERVAPLLLAALAAVAALFAVGTVDRNRDWRDDVTLFRNETARTPEAPLLWSNLAQAEMRAGRFDAADDAIRRAERLAPASAWVLAVRAQWLTFAGRYAEALRLQERVVRLERRGHALARNNLAFLYRMSGRTAEAVEILTELVTRLPSYPDPWFNLAEIERGAGETERAIPYLHTYLELRPGDLRAVEILAGILARSGRGGEAELLYFDAMTGGAVDARLWNNVAALRLAAGDRTGAEEAVARALAIDPAYPRALLNHARLLVLAGRAAEARGELERLTRTAAGTDVGDAARSDLGALAGTEPSPPGENGAP